MKGMTSRLTFSTEKGTYNSFSITQKWGATWGQQRFLTTAAEFSIRADRGLRATSVESLGKVGAQWGETWGFRDPPWMGLTHPCHQRNCFLVDTWCGQSPLATKATTPWARSKGSASCIGSMDYRLPIPELHK